MDRRILFVHGLGGDEKTWGDFPKFLAADSDLKATAHFFKYPTPLLGLKFFYLLQNSYQNLQDLAKGLKTAIDNLHKDADEIILVGHSMGGLVVRQYLLDEYIARREPRVNKVILYAVPNEGSSLAQIAKNISVYKNPHLLQLCKSSDFIDLLNQNWTASTFYENNEIDFTVVVAGNDKIVNRRSAEGIFRHLTPEHIPHANHFSIVKPESADSLAYQILKNSILKKKYLPQIKHKCLGLRDFSEWQKYKPESNFTFCKDEDRDVVYKGLSEELTKSSSCVRITGLSGLGKTRLVYEVISNAPDDIKNKVVYVDAANDVQNIQGWLQSAIENGFEGILIVDNCKSKLHIALAQEASRQDSKVIFVSLDHYLDNLSATQVKEFRLKPLATDSIKKMLEPLFAKQIDQVERIAVFAGGFPQMAVLIANARVANDPDIGRLNDDDLLNKLLGDIDANERSILKSCALFDRFGFDAEVASHYHFIAETFVELPRKTFAECVKKFQQRGLIDISGRYAQLVPKPLAVRLASEWWVGTHRDDQLALLGDIPEALVQPFCKQVTMLGFIDEVQELTKDLCGPQGFFGQAEAILSERGSLLFRSFVEVNPEATSRVLYQNLIKLSYKDLLNIKDDVRRNLVWALEKLVFHKSVFEDASWCLLLLASAENESWSNNATGQFEQLFGVWLSGTEADFQSRLRILKRALESNDEKIESVIVQALGHAISTHSGSRTVGAEYQGNRPPLEEYRPKIWQEIFDYWTAIYDLLIGIVEKNQQLSNKALVIIGSSIRGMIQHGRIDMLDDVITKIILMRGRFWPSALESISQSKEYDSNGLPKEGVDALDKWAQMLSPEESNLIEKLQIIVVDPPWEHKKDSDNRYVNLAEIKAEKLASELAGTVELGDEHLSLLLSGHPKESFSFGRKWALIATNVDGLIERILSQIDTRAELDLNFLLGLLAGVYQLDQSKWEEYLMRFVCSSELVTFSPRVLRTGKIESRHLEIFLELIFSETLAVQSANSLSYGSALSHLDSETVVSFCLRLAKFNAQSQWAALDILFMYCFGESEKFIECSDALKTLSSRVSLKQSSRLMQTDMYHWSETVSKFILENEYEFCRKISNQIILAAREHFEFDDLIYHVKPVLTSIFKLFGNRLWPDYGLALITAEGKELWELSRLMERENSFSLQKPSLLNYISQDTLILWCKQNIGKAPYFLARNINIFTIDSNNNKIPNPLFVTLLEQFGHLDHFGGELSANLASIGWSGSLVPYLQSDKAALSILLEHHSPVVREWVRSQIEYIDKTITYEQIRDSEHDAGIY